MTRQIDNRYDYDVISAAGDGDLPRLKALLDKGGDPNAEIYVMYGEYVFTALGEAFDGKQYEAMDMLLAYGADPHMDYDYYTAFVHGVALSGDVKAMDILLNYEPDLNLKSQAYFRGAHGNYQFHSNLTPRDAAEKGGKPAMAALLERFAEIPALAEDAAVTKAQLLAKNKNGDTLLDHPSTWRQFERVSQELAARGEHLDKQDLLPHLPRAVGCHAFGKLLAEMNAAGDGLRADDLLEKDGGLTPLMEKLIDRQMVQEVFRLANWKGASPDDVSRLYHALPEAGQAQVRNYRSLRTQLSPARGAGRSEGIGY